MFLIWDISDTHWKVKPPDIKFDFWTATLLYSDMLCDHLHDIGGDSFLLIFIVVNTSIGVTSAFCYHQGTNTWVDTTTTKGMFGSSGLKF